MAVKEDLAYSLITKRDEGFDHLARDARISSGKASHHQS
jgi:hypothetical protein